MQRKHTLNKIFRWWSAWAVLALAVLISTSMVMFHIAPFSPVHAAGSGKSATGPALSMPVIVHAYDTVSVTGQGFAASDYVILNLINTSYTTYLGYMTCDSNGNCSSTVTAPYTGFAQGAYTVSGTGRTGLTAQASITLLPAIATRLYANLDPVTSAGPGAILEVDGGAFNPNETVKVLWGTTLETTTTTGNDGSFSYYALKVPKNAAPGRYAINVTRTGQTPAQVSTYFTVLAPKLVSSAGIRNSQPLHVQISGFQASENVAISWDANGGQTITTLAVDATGAINTYVAPPFAAKGAYTLTATGVSSGLKATSGLHIGPGILLTPNTANPGGTTTVSGGGYTPGETVNVYFQAATNGVTSASVDSSGSFSVSLSIPFAYKKGTVYSVYAVSTTGSDAAKAQFFYAIPSINVYCGCAYGEAFSVIGQEFIAQEVLSIYRQYDGQQTPVLLGKVTTATDGSFKFQSTMTSAPYTASGYPTPANMTIIVERSRSKQVFTARVDVSTNIIPTPGAGQVGQKIKLNGGGFGSSETVTLSFQNHPLGTVVAAPNGGFSTTFIVPKGSVPGNYFIKLLAVGNTTGVTVNVDFGVLPAMKISPTTGPSGTVITVSGSGYYPYDLLDIDWYDPATKTETQITSLQAINGGAFSTTITAPANLVSGTTYDVMVIDGGGGSSLQAPFVAQ